MNGSGEDRYSSNWEKLSRTIRKIYPCYFCGKDNFGEKEAHHIDGNKRNGSLRNAIVLCMDCHRKVHKGELNIPNSFKGYKLSTVNKIKSSI